MQLLSLPSVLLAALLATCVQSSPAPIGILARDFSDDSRNFNQIVQLMHNMRTRIGIPFKAMVNIGLQYPQTVEIDPLDLALLPSGYCFSCDTHHANPDESKHPNPLANSMIEIDEDQLILICAESDEEHGFEWPLVKECPGSKDILKDFLVDLRLKGNRVAVPKSRVLKAPLLETGRRCMPKDPSKTTCAPMTSRKTKNTASAATTMPSVGEYVAGIYSAGRGKAAARTSYTPVITASPTLHPSLSRADHKHRSSKHKLLPTSSPSNQNSTRVSGGQRIGSYLVNATSTPLTNMATSGNSSATPLSATSWINATLPSHISSLFNSASSAKATSLVNTAVSKNTTSVFNSTFPANISAAHTTKSTTNVTSPKNLTTSHNITSLGPSSELEQQKRNSTSIVQVSSASSLSLSQPTSVITQLTNPSNAATTTIPIPTAAIMTPDSYWASVYQDLASWVHAFPSWDPQAPATSAAVPSPISHASDLSTSIAVNRTTTSAIAPTPTVPAESNISLLSSWIQDHPKATATAAPERLAEELEKTKDGKEILNLVAGMCL